MTDAEAPELVLLGGEEDEQSGLRRYDPGGLLSGLVRLRGHPRARGVYVLARWRSAGRDTIDPGVAAERRIHQGALGAEQSVEVSFQYRLPWEPWSYAGKLVRVEWEIEARLDVPWGHDRVAAARFILAPRPPFADGRRAGPASRKRDGD